MALHGECIQWHDTTCGTFSCLYCRDRCTLRIRRLRFEQSAWRSAGEVEKTNGRRKISIPTPESQLIFHSVVALLFADLSFQQKHL